MTRKYKLAVLDLETDPFKHGRKPLPFAAGFFDGDTYHQTWGDNCIAEMIEFLREYPEPLRIYAHNGGKFDFWYLQDWLDNPLFFIKTRLVRCAFLERHELRDSYAILPVPLRDYKKDDTDYATFEVGVREKHRKAICRYLQHDCEYLYELVEKFTDEFGYTLTIGTTALKALKKLHPQNHSTAWHDAEFRPYYFGGRVECFASGYQKGDFKFYDVNSMYPFVMSDCEHPSGPDYTFKRTLPDSGFYFADITAFSRGALPVRLRNGSLAFPHGTHRFHACSHEIQTALQAGLLKIETVHEVKRAVHTQSFADFVDKFIRRKIEYEEAGDKAMRLFMKLILNSAYGKFATDPTQFTDVELFDDYAELQSKGFELAGTFGNRLLGEKPTTVKSYSYHDVAVAASITSASRAVLLQAITKASRPIYCDTDSIVAESLDMPLHDLQLGSWKNEASANEVHIAGKKMYAAFLNGQGVKKASKGVQLSYQDIVRVAAGEQIVSAVDAPNLRMGKEPKFMQRTIASTVNV